MRVPGSRAGTYTSTVTTWGATTQAILELRAFLEREEVTTVVMEATSECWKPFFYLLEETPPVMLVNATAARNIPGRKTDVSDAAWLAQLGAHGLLRGSFVLPEPIRELRDLTRARALATRDRAREIQRLEKFLESSWIKFSSVVSDLTGVPPATCSRPSSTGNGTRRSWQAWPEEPCARKFLPSLTRSPAGSNPTMHSWLAAPGPDRCIHPDRPSPHRTHRGGDGTLS